MGQRALVRRSTHRWQCFASRLAIKGGKGGVSGQWKLQTGRLVFPSFIDELHFGTDCKEARAISAILPSKAWAVATCRNQVLRAGLSNDSRQYRGAKHREQSISNADLNFWTTTRSVLYCRQLATVSYLESRQAARRTYQRPTWFDFFNNKMVGPPTVLGPGSTWPTNEIRRVAHLHLR